MDKVALQKKAPEVHSEVVAAIRSYQKVSNKKGKAGRRKLLLEKEISRRQHLNGIEAEIARSEMKLAQMNEAASAIQRAFKVYTTRKQNDEVLPTQKLIQISRVHLADQLITLRRVTEFCFIAVGPARVAVSSTQSVQLIKRTYKRFKFRAKLNRLRNAFMAYMLERRNLAEVLISQLTHVFAAKATVLAIIKEDQKQATLLKVRRRLAIIIVRTHWRGLRLNFKAMQIKIIKYKRKVETINRRKALFSRYAAGSPKNAVDLTPPRSNFQSPSLMFSMAVAYTTEDVASTRRRDSGLSGLLGSDITKANEKIGSRAPSRHDSDEDAMLEEKLKREYREQMNLAKVAHNIPAYADKLPMPCLQERTVSSSVYSIGRRSISPQSRILSSTAAYLGRSARPRRVGTSGPYVRNTLIQTPPTAPCKFRQGQVRIAAPMPLTMPKDIKVKVNQFRSLSFTRPHSRSVQHNDGSSKAKLRLPSSAIH